jgi:hypothetical protein
MYLSIYRLFGITLLLLLGAVICFCMLVIKPLQTRWAVSKARKIVASGQLPSGWQFRNIYRMLATSHEDLEAEKLWRQIDGMIEATQKHQQNYEFMKIVGIIPRDNKF